MSTATARKLPSQGPATTPDEIGARLIYLAGKLQRKIAKGRRLTMEDMGYLAKKLGDYGARLQSSRPLRPYYAYKCSFGTWKILPIGESEFVLVIDDRRFAEYPTAEAAAYDVRKKRTGHKEWDATKEKAPAGLHQWKKIGKAPELSLVT